ncbi:hypothetical protein BS297_30715 [Rhodococcus erythropolis]|uniref:DUF4913 domain-containing protein n=1 Tax=Rhodococcus erythropolis TaxID=1833 RepID=A0A5N5DUX3_RHOER|nr:DUF4913 domain-containing protein [Rhodococcus erythropolis]MCW0191090.1 DUF4913 domain-containing protein [Rhodococcus sp. (in: high G+C Gram-positive bacteria)]AGT95324.1 hypothetical protein O5Y_27535 [Rhodococcus erythropolis CCM2595]KAB2581473.1 hypothetical protein BS297_30715 [Rhodococcus erythropolis]MBF7733444.1 DUF4913 domain-containing protein [Rhodococcus erythropolis]MCZ4642107.1 DUF4913 domain-containing protein [Rhodococcus erythropolis]
MNDEFSEFDGEGLEDHLPTRVYRWKDLDGEQAAELWAELIAWVSWFRRRYSVTGSDAVIPPCWYRHPVAVEELTALMVSHQSAYTLDEPGSELSAFHVQWLWLTLRGLAERAGYKRCTDVKCSFKAPEVVDDPGGLEEWISDDIASRH